MQIHIHQETELHRLVKLDPEDVAGYISMRKPSCAREHKATEQGGGGSLGRGQGLRFFFKTNGMYGSGNVENINGSRMNVFLLIILKVYISKIYSTEILPFHFKIK